MSDVRVVFWGAEGDKSADIVVAANHHIAVVVILPPSPAVNSWASASGCFGGPTTACAVSLGDSAHGGTGFVGREAWAGAARGDRMLTSKAWTDIIMGKEVLVTGHGGLNEYISLPPSCGFLSFSRGGFKSMELKIIPAYACEWCFV